MKILLIEPYYGGSHRTWADGYQRHSQHEVTLLTLPAQFWKWRMQGGAVTLARLYRQLCDERGYRPDVIIASDMFNLATFRSLTRDLTHAIPIVCYFHESQLTYPQNSRQQHGWRYAFVNYISALSAERVYFNSPYHLSAFFENLPRMLSHFGDHKELQTVTALREKASILALGLDLARYDGYRHEHTEASQSPLILWNHRWEEDKNPSAFFSALYRLADADIGFRVALVGEQFGHIPPEFDEARARLGERVTAYGYQDSFANYARLLWQADYVVSTAKQEFFGGAIAEAIYCGCVPILPNRLNYPNLLPESAHSTCLYQDKGEALFYSLHEHLTGQLTVDSVSLRDYIVQFDWSVMASRYDATFELLQLQ